MSVDLFLNQQFIECVCFLSNNNARTKDYIEISMDTEDYNKVKVPEQRGKGE